MKPFQQPIVELDHIHKRYRSGTSLFKTDDQDIVALDDISLEINKGEILGLVGESGSGKTTIGRLIVNLEAPDGGTICLDGEDITAIAKRNRIHFRSTVQMIFQDPYQSLNPQLSVLATVMEPLVIHKAGNSASMHHRVLQSLDFVGLRPPEDFLNRYPHQLSGGERQRVAIARAMVLHPRFMVADEPTSMLDATVQLQIFDILLELKQKMGMTILFITHSMNAAQYLCDRTAVIYRGRLMELGPAREVMERPGHPYSKALIDAHPSFGHADKTPYGTLLDTQRDEVKGDCCRFFTRCDLAQHGVCDVKSPALKQKADGHAVACFFL